MQQPTALGRPRQDKDENSSTPWFVILSKCAFSAVTYPIEYVRVLIQLGYEPLEPIPTRRLFGKPALLLPGAFTYMGYIRSVDGFFGLYRGFSASFCGNFVQNAVFVQLTTVMPPVPTFEADQVESSEETKVVHFVQRTTQQMVARAIATIVSQPFIVVASRMMAQFIGGEVKYSSVFGSFREIVHDEGVLCLWNGLMPRLTGEVVRIWLAGSVAFFINNYIVEDVTVRSYISATTNFLAASMTYPFSVVGTVMCVTGAPIEAGGAPHLARYESWSQCWGHLGQLGQLKRGSSLFWRYYQGPIQTTPGGIPRKIPVDVSLIRKLN